MPACRAAAIPLLSCGEVGPFLPLFQDCSQAVPLTQKLGPAGGSSRPDGQGGCWEDLPCLSGCPLLSAGWLSTATLLAQHCQIFRWLGDAGNRDVCKICKKKKKGTLKVPAVSRWVLLATLLESGLQLCPCFFWDPFSIFITWIFKFPFLVGLFSYLLIKSKFVTVKK